jgi:hypothetical protein
MRTPSINPKRDREIARLRKLLADLQRLPEHRREAEGADEREEIIRAMLRDLEPKRVYQWTTDDDEIAEDAIMVGIGGVDLAMLSIGIGYEEPTADIYWCARVTSEGVFDAGKFYGPMPVPQALELAEGFRQRMGYERVVVTLQEAGMWRDTWGRLADREGY